MVKRIVDTGAELGTISQDQVEVGLGARGNRDQKVRDTLVEKIIEKYGIEHYVTSAVHLTFDELRNLAREGSQEGTTT